jgi:hypothetical protein
MYDINIQINSSLEGDITLTAPKADIEGNTMYNEYGKEIRDISLINDIEWFKQMIFNRLKTQNPDWFHQPTIGADLEDLIGEQNTREVAEIGRTRIHNALIKDGLVYPQYLTIRAVPVDKNTLMYFINIDKPYRITIYTTFNFTEGIMEVNTL